MTEKILTAVFQVESEAYQALSELKKNAIGNDFIVSQAAIVANENGHIVTKDWFDSGVESRNDTHLGGFLGAMIGIVGGPLGMLLGGSWGMLIGSTIDAVDVKDNVSVLEKVSGTLTDGETALLVLLQEQVPDVFENQLNKYSVSIIKEDAAEVMEEIENAKRVEKQLAKEAKKQMREEKARTWKEKVEGHREKIKEHFDKLKNK